MHVLQLLWDTCKNPFNKILSPNVSKTVSAMEPPEKLGRPPNSMTSVSPGPRLIAVVECLQRGITEAGVLNWRKGRLRCIENERFSTSTCTPTIRIQSHYLSPLATVNIKYPHVLQYVPAFTQSSKYQQFWMAFTIVETTGSMACPVHWPRISS